MACEHNAIRCTNGVFYCLLCGMKIDPLKDEKLVETENKAATDTPKKRAKKGANK